MKVGEELIEDKKEIASNLNSFFVEKVKRISEGIPDTDTDPLNTDTDTDPLNFQTLTLIH